MALLPTWGDKLTAPWGAGPRLFRNDNLDVARGYAKYLAGKLRTRTNVLWVLGGDRPPRLTDDTVKAGTNAGFAPGQDWTPIWRALAEGLKQGSEGTPTIAYHPTGGERSSTFLHQETWLSINGMQSGHGEGHDVPVWEMIAGDYVLTPAKPTLDLEPNYEDHPYNPWPRWDPSTGYFRDHDVRKQLYRSVFAGGCGVTYGHHAVWQFAGPGREAINHADRDWKDAVYRPGGAPGRISARAYRIEAVLSPHSRPIDDCRRCRPGAAVPCRRRGSGRSHAFVYFPENDHRATIDLGSLRSKELRAWWFDPRTGIGTQIRARRRQQDLFAAVWAHWVLVVDDANAGYGPPGLSSTHRNAQEQRGPPASTMEPTMEAGVGPGIHTENVGFCARFTYGSICAPTDSSASCRDDPGLLS